MTRPLDPDSPRGREVTQKLAAWAARVELRIERDKAATQPQPERKAA